MSCSLRAALLPHTSCARPLLRWDDWYELELNEALKAKQPESWFDFVCALRGPAQHALEARFLHKPMPCALHAGCAEARPGKALAEELGPSCERAPQPHKSE